MKPEIKNLIEKQDKEFEEMLKAKTDSGGFQLIGYEKAEENLKTFIAKVRKESIEYERERIKKEFIERMKEIATKEL